jgi:hypothetical protein
MMDASRIVIAAPMSYAGSLGRTLNWFWHGRPPIFRFGVGIWAIPILTVVWWLAISVWYFFFGLLLFPYRLLRRGSRKRKREARMHQETLQAIRDSKSDLNPPQ